MKTNRTEVAHIFSPTVCLEPFFLHLCSVPPDPALSIPRGSIDYTAFDAGLLPSDLLSTRMKTARLRQKLSPRYKVPVFDPTISERQWKMFWNSNIHFKSRDLWYRLLHHKLSCQLALHRAIPTIFDDPSCPLCHTNPEASTHFIYSCQHKHPIREYVWDTFFDTPFSQSALHCALFSLQLLCNGKSN
jgi:hypothetical protein